MSWRDRRGCPWRCKCSFTLEHHSCLCAGNMLPRALMKALLVAMPSFMMDNTASADLKRALSIAQESEFRHSEASQCAAHILKDFCSVPSSSRSCNLQSANNSIIMGQYEQQENTFCVKHSCLFTHLFKAMVKTHRHFVITLSA
jgi:hypothetical protein